MWGVTRLEGWVGVALFRVPFPARTRVPFFCTLATDVLGGPFVRDVSYNFTQICRHLEGNIYACPRKMSFCYYELFFSGVCDVPGPSHPSPGGQYLAVEVLTYVMSCQGGVCLLVKSFELSLSYICRSTFSSYCVVHNVCFFYCQTHVENYGRVLCIGRYIGVPQRRTQHTFICSLFVTIGTRGLQTRQSGSAPSSTHHVVGNEWARV